MPRVISFIVLLAIVLVVGAVFFQVMAQFIVPLFLACVLLVIFQPLHFRIVDLLPERPRLAALLTTLVIALVILLPLTWLSWKSYTDLKDLIERATQEVSEPDQSVGARRSDVVNPPIAPAQPKEGSDTVVAEIESDAKPAVGERFAEKLKGWTTDLRTYLAEQGIIEVTEDDLEGYLKSIARKISDNLPSTLQTILGAAVGLLIGLVIMMVALYYFLADGPGMVRALMRLSPLDDRYERELLWQFADISRAVVVATLLSAVVQGTLAGIGYYFTLPSEAPIFLLTAATMVLAVVPFVGTAGVWVPTCIALLFLGHVGSAIGLGVYCALFVSLSDNIIKPFILHGQANLHPLLALLSILGGVQVLGPIGILVGPMIVSFLQALLNMLHRELDLLGKTSRDAATVLAESATGVVQDAVKAIAETNTAADENLTDKSVAADKSAAKLSTAKAETAKSTARSRRRRK